MVIEVRKQRHSQSVTIKNDEFKNSDVIPKHSLKKIIQIQEGTRRYIFNDDWLNVYSNILRYTPHHSSQIFSSRNKNTSSFSRSLPPPPPPPAGACVLEQEKGDPVKRVASLSMPVQVHIKYCRNYFHYSFNWQAYAIFVEINFGISFIEIIFARCFNILKRMLIRYYRHSSLQYLAIKIYLHSCTILHYTVMYIILTFKINHLKTVRPGLNVAFYMRRIELPS